ncbi:MAG: hypothetical protein JWL85_897 [Candidatus Saccharibacteria bacterium]|nr:hypothetical protein [Candidatus Saccharibacteria bacterium]
MHEDERALPPADAIPRWRKEYTEDTALGMIGRTIKRDWGPVVVFKRSDGQEIYVHQQGTQSNPTFLSKDIDREITFLTPDGNYLYRKQGGEATMAPIDEHGVEGPEPCTFRELDHLINTLLYDSTRTI